MIDGPVQLNVATLEIRDPILMMTDLFLDLHELNVASLTGQVDGLFCLIKEVENVMEPGHRGEMLPIWEQVLTRKTWQQHQVWSSGG